MPSWNMEWRNMKYVIADIEVGKVLHKNLFIKDVDRERNAFFTYRDGGKGQPFNWVNRPVTINVRRRLTLREAYELLKKRNEPLDEDFWQRLLEKYGEKTPAVDLNPEDYNLRALSGDSGTF